MRSCAALSKRGVIFRPMTRRSNCSTSSCVRSRRIGKCRRGNGQRRKRNSPSCSTHGSSQHDGQPAPHTKYLTLPCKVQSLFEDLNLHGLATKKTFELADPVLELADFRSRNGVLVGSNGFLA